jgi:2-methylcitrate dehydratase PrpD
MTLSQQLVARWKALPAGAIPHAVKEAAKLHLLDSIGVGLAAAATDAGQPYLAAVAALNGNGGAASVFASGNGFAPATAALANGGMIHALEYDDTHTASIVHGSSVLTATALATAEGLSASGESLLTAYIKGWETLIRVGLAAPGKFQAQGFQITSVAGALAAALVACDLSRIDDARKGDALGIALSQASGVFEFLTNGSTVKSLHAGWAAHAGIVASTMAGAGLTGPETAFEGQFGLFRRFAMDPGAVDRFAAEIATFGGEWHLPEAAFKFYPCCHYIHPFIEALEIALAQNPDEPVEAIVCEVPPGAAPLISDPWERKLKPRSGHDARYSLPIALATRLVEGAVTPMTFANMPNLKIMDKAECISARPMTNADFPQRFEARLQVRFAKGNVVEVYVDDVFGGSRRPPSRETVLTKFRANAGLIGQADDVCSLEAAVLAIDHKRIDEVTRLLRRVRRGFPQYAAMRGGDECLIL